MSILETLLSHVAEITLALSAVISALLALRPLLARRYRSKLYYWAWLLVAVRLAIPFNPSLPDPLVQVQTPAVTVYQVEPTRAQPGTPRYRALTEAGYQAEVQEEAARAEAPVTQVQAQYTPVLELPQLLALLWLAGGSVFLLWSLAVYARFRLRMRRWRAPEEQPAVQAQFEALRRELGVRRLTLQRCPAVTSPLVTGFVRPALLLPAGDFSPADLDAVFRHELVHARRHDLWYKLLLLLARSVHWFNPLVHLMARQAARDLELSCDEAVVAGRDAAFREQYGRAILSAVERGCRQGAPLTSYFYGGRKAMLERLRAIVGRGGKRRGLILLCAVALVVAALAAACSVGSSSGEDPNPSDGLSAKSGSLPGYDGPVAWAMGHYTVELDWEHSADGQGGRLTFYLVRDKNGETTRIPFQRLPEDYGPDLRYPYPSSVAARPFSGVLGQEGFVLTYALGSESVPTEYYTLDGDGAFRLLLSCDGQVWELDLDNDGDAELLECPYGADGEARVYDWISVGGLSLEQGGPGQVAVADVNHAAARKLGFIQGGVGLEYLPPEGGSKPGDPMGFRCFAQLNDMGTPAGNAVPTDRTLSLSWDELNGFQAPVSSFTADQSPLWPADPDGMDRDSGTLWWNDADGQGYGVDFSLHIPADVSVHELGSGCHEYWAADPVGDLVLLDDFSLLDSSTDHGLTDYLGDGVFVRTGMGWYDGSLDAQFGNSDTYRAWYYPLADGVHCLRLRWTEADLETAERIRATLVLSNDGPIQRTYYDYEKPTAEMFGLTDEYAAIFDYLVDQRWESCQADHTLYFPRMVCYGTYTKAGRDVYVCWVAENFYYDLTLENRTVTPGWGGSLMAFSIGYGGPGIPYDAPMVDVVDAEQDGEGSAQSVRNLCGPLTDLADAYLGVSGALLPAPVWNEMASEPELLRAYVAATGAPIDSVAIYGTDLVPLEDYWEGW